MSSASSHTVSLPLNHSALLLLPSAWPLLLLLHTNTNQTGPPRLLPSQATRSTWLRPLLCLQMRSSCASCSPCTWGCTGGTIYSQQSSTKVRGGAAGARTPGVDICACCLAAPQQGRPASSYPQGLKLLFWFAWCLTDTRLVPLLPSSAFSQLCHPPPSPLPLPHTAGHVGYELSPFIPTLEGVWALLSCGLRGSPRLNTVQHHDIHHRFPTKHFSLYFTHWDRWMGTLHPKYEANLFRYFGSSPKA